MCLAGIAIVALGIVCLVNPGTTILSLALAIGLMFLVGGCSAFAAWGSLRHFLPQSGLIFFSALMQVLLGLFFIINPAPLAIGLPFIFAFWVMFEGVNIAIESFDFKRVGFSYWWLLLCIGVLAACFGAYGLYRPELSAQTLSVIVSVGIILDGIGYWIRVAAANKLEKFIKEIAA